MPILLPTLPLTRGVTWGIRKSSRFSTVTQNPVSGARPVSFSVSPYPSWEWELPWEHIRDQDLQTVNDFAGAPEPDFFLVQDFYLTMNGSNGRFIFDPAANIPKLDDCFISQTVPGTLVNGYSGVTDGLATVYQLYRSSRANGTLTIVEPIDVLSAVTFSLGITPFGLYLNGTLVPPANYTLSQYPLQVTFGVAPAAGQTLSWTGVYAYVAKFLEDKQDLNQFLYQLYEIQAMKIEQVPLGF